MALRCDIYIHRLKTPGNRIIVTSACRNTCPRRITPARATIRYPMSRRHLPSTFHAHCRRRRPLPRPFIRCKRARKQHSAAAPAGYTPDLPRYASSVMLKYAQKREAAAATTQNALSFAPPAAQKRLLSYTPTLPRFCQLPRPPDVAVRHRCADAVQRRGVPAENVFRRLLRRKRSAAQNAQQTRRIRSAAGA